MPTQRSKAKVQKRTIKKLKKTCTLLQNNKNSENEKLAEITKLLGTACKYCNNLENHLKSKGYSRKCIEDIKDSNYQG